MALPTATPSSQYAPDVDGKCRDRDGGQRTVNGSVGRLEDDHLARFSRPETRERVVRGELDETVERRRVEDEP